MKQRAIILVSILLFSCGGNVKQPPPSVLVMVDFSESAKPLLPDYKKFLGEILSKVPAHGRIVVGKIQKTTEASFEPFVNRVIPGDPGLMDVEEDVRDQQRALQRTIQLAIDSVFGNPTFSGGTNIVSALRLVKQVFPQSDRRVLVLLSDMQHVSSEFNLEKAALTGNFVEETLGRLQQAGRIPDLKGMAVYVAGATAKTDERYNQIKEFWDRLFAQSGAELKTYSRTLLNFEP